MLRIDRLQLRLPAEYRDRAHWIARLVARELATLPADGGKRLDRLSLPPVVAAPGTGSHGVARAIAAAIKAQLNAVKGHDTRGGP